MIGRRRQVNGQRLAEAAEQTSNDRGSDRICWSCRSCVDYFLGSVKYFVYKYPHDAMNGLGALSFAVIVFPVSWVFLYMWAMKWQHVRAWRGQEAERFRDGR
jgi:hypothetical protein